MTLQSGKIDQKEYLKKYLSGTSEEKKKKKKKIATGIKRVKIIDDDIDLKSMRNLDSNELELYQLSEDAPVIAGIVDERPPEVQQADKYKDKRWKVITGGSDEDVQISDKNEPKNKTNISSFRNIKESDLPPPKKSKLLSKKLGLDFSETKKSRKKSPDSDQSPPRNYNKKSRQNSDSNISPPKKISQKAREDSDCDISLPKKLTKKFRRNSDSDQSPPRKTNKKYKRNSDSDISPPRKSNKKSRQYSDSDISPPRKSNQKSRQNSDSDISPPRKSKNQTSSSHEFNSKRNKNDSDKSLHRRSRRNSDSDISPPRKSRREQESNKNRTQSSKGNFSPSRKETKSSSKYSQRNSHSDLSPSRKSRNETKSNKNKYQENSDSDLSPPRKSRKVPSKHKSQENSDSDLSPPRKSRKDVESSSHKSRGSDSDLSPPRKRQNDTKMEKTLDGKQAGLQDAKQLVQENQEFKRREDDLFRKMKASVSGAEAGTVLRDRKTGRVRDLDEEAREARKRNEKDSEHKEKYDKWGRGVKQGQDFQARIAQDLHEMAKPLARYRDDEDLEQDLKQTLRAEDPMLQYVLSKREKTEADLKPKYKGAWPPNRFNIPPGYRWDGVDRSSGYEKQLFLAKSAKKATEEEAYHWSISDM